MLWERCARIIAKPQRKLTLESLWAIAAYRKCCNDYPPVAKAESRLLAELLFNIVHKLVEHAAFLHSFKGN